MTHILAIDQGTTSSRAILFDAACASSPWRRRSFRRSIPQAAGSNMTRPTCGPPSPAPRAQVIERAGIGAGDIAAIGITNQRETTLVWDRETGQPIHNAIVWQDRRTADLCQRS
jgi:glycerol kinase